MGAVYGVIIKLLRPRSTWPTEGIKKELVLVWLCNPVEINEFVKVHLVYNVPPVRSDQLAFPSSNPRYKGNVKDKIINLINFY